MGCTELFTTLTPPHTCYLLHWVSPSDVCNFSLLVCFWCANSSMYIHIYYFIKPFKGP